MDIFGSDDENENANVAEVAKTCYSKLLLPQRVKIPSENSAVLLKMPNFVKIQTAQFVTSGEGKEHGRTAQNEEEEEMQFSGATSLIRWRNKTDSNGNVVIDEKTGKPVRESNARLVKWSDGTMELLVGNEAFKVGFVPMSNTYACSHETSSSTNVPENLNDAIDDPNYVNKPISNTSCLEYVTAVDRSMRVEPSSLTSAAHLRTSLKLSDKYKKVTKMSTRNMRSLEENPDVDVKLQIQLEDREARVERKKRQVQAQGDRGASKYFGSYGSGVGMNAGFLEEEEDNGGYDNISLAALKNKNHRGSSSRADGRFNESPPQKKKTPTYDSEGEEEEDDEDEDGEEMNDFIVSDDGEGEDEADDYDDDGKNDSDDDDDDEEGEDDIDEEEEEDDDDDDEGNEEEKKHKKHKKHHKHHKHHDHKKKAKSSSKRHTEDGEDNEKAKKKSKTSHKAEEDMGDNVTSSADGTSSTQQMSKQKRLILDEDDD